MANPAAAAYSNARTEACGVVLLLTPFEHTVDTTRLAVSTPLEMAVATSRLEWPYIHPAFSPRTVIIVPDRYFPFAYAAACLVHPPIRGTLLTSPAGVLPAVVAEEIKRLNPQGSRDVPPVIMVGPFKQRVITAVEGMGYEVLYIIGRNIFAVAANVARFRQEVPPKSLDGPRCLFVVSAENPYEGIAAAYYAAHSGVPILLTYQQHVPAVTVKVLQEMAGKTIYVIGSRRSVADSVLSEIGDLTGKPVQRIAGNDAVGTALALAQFYDAATGLGWHRTEKGRGDAFTFSNAERWDLALAAVALAHQGKHTPLLLVGKNRLPSAVQEYLQELRPASTMPPVPPFMHGFILGTTRQINEDVQAAVEMNMKIDVKNRHA